ncbi:MAG: haloacid dehalogenase-like hydrolase [Bacteroidetes bacterium]|nr:haloacid dehalogenase-like hydrolase [Bacteroidota bacterium]
MHIGIDFDNTIVCYDKVFHKVAVESGLILPDMPPGKNNVRDYLRKMEKEDEWTRLQGLVYGTKMDEAEAFDGIFDFLHQCRQSKIDISIISHKTRHPYLGPKYDLHLAALQWMEAQGFFNPKKLGLSREQIFFELTKTDKINRITDAGCTHFIDDLPEFFLEPSFPKNAISILFDPNNSYLSGFPFQRVSSWNEVLKELRIAHSHE